MTSQTKTPPKVYKCSVCRECFTRDEYERHISTGTDCNQELADREYRKQSNQIDSNEYAMYHRLEFRVK